MALIQVSELLIYSDRFGTCRHMPEAEAVSHLRSAGPNLYKMVTAREMVAHVISPH